MNNIVVKFRIIGSDGVKLTEDTVVTAELLPSPFSPYGNRTVTIIHYGENNTDIIDTRYEPMVLTDFVRFAYNQVRARIRREFWVEVME